MANTVFLKGYPIRKEGVAGGAITPGHFLNINSSGQVVVAGTLGIVTRSVAFENELIGNDLNDAYASGDNVLYGDCYSGMEVNALVAAGAAAIVVGARLEVKADGTLGVVTTGTPIARALQAVDNSGGGTAVRCVVAIL